MSGRGCWKDTDGREGTLMWDRGDSRSGSECEGKVGGEEVGPGRGPWWESGRGNVPMPLSRVLV